MITRTFPTKVSIPLQLGKATEGREGGEVTPEMDPVEVLEKLNVPGLFHLKQFLSFFPKDLHPHLSSVFSDLFGFQVHLLLDPSFNIRALVAEVTFPNIRLQLRPPSFTLQQTTVVCTSGGPRDMLFFPALVSSPILIHSEFRIPARSIWLSSC